MSSRCDLEIEVLGMQVNFSISFRECSQTLNALPFARQVAAGQWIERHETNHRAV
jgi:hypothetical protein